MVKSIHNVQRTKLYHFQLITELTPASHDIDTGMIVYDVEVVSREEESFTRCDCESIVGDVV